MEIAEIWSEGERIKRWHQTWLDHLDVQEAINPNHPATAEVKKRYQQAAERYPHEQGIWDQNRHWAQERNQHEVVAALEEFNRQAGADLLHHGLASSDIVDPTTQSQIVDSMLAVIEHAVHLADRLRVLMIKHRHDVLVARTHGQPAQVTTWGHRQATVLGPLMSWIDRASSALLAYPARPIYGAVGTAADLQRVLCGWGDGEVLSTGLEAQGSVLGGGGGTETPSAPGVLDGREISRVQAYVTTLAYMQGARSLMPVTRQVYHRSYDLTLINLLVELAAIAQTWVTDRRLESALGLGNEGDLSLKVASSSMALKENPRFCERVNGLAVVTRGYYSMLAELAGVEWLEGDVSGSAARKIALPGIFTTIDDLLVNWLHIALIWEPDLTAMAAEVDRCEEQLAGGALLHALVESGMSRTEAHKRLRRAWHEASRIGGPFRSELSDLAEEEVDDIIADVPTQIGNVQEQIDLLDWRTTKAVETIAPAPWAPQVRP